MRKRILTSLLTASAYALALALALAACGPKSGPAASLPPSGGASSCLSPSGSIPPQPAFPTVTRLNCCRAVRWRRTILPSLM